MEEKAIKFNNPVQIINMGGPWIGELQIKDRIIADNVIIDNVYYNSNQQKLYFVRYHDVSKWKKNNFFLIYSLELRNNQLRMYDFKFEQVFIESVSDNEELTYFAAFHNRNLKDMRKISLENF